MCLILVPFNPGLSYLGPSGPVVWTFSCAYSKRPKDERKTAQGFSPGKVRRLALPKQDRIMLPAGLDILGRPKGENRIAHGLQPWEDGPERNRPERAAEGRSFPKDNVRRKRLDGVSEAHEALPDTKICGDARP